LAIDQAVALLARQMTTLGDDFREEGGFTERMSRARLETRDAKIAAAGAPKCPKCGKPMRKIIARKGRNAGNPFWSCSGYPDCNGTRNYVAPPIGGD
jgi:four helix bundle suffix protein